MPPTLDQITAQATRFRDRLDALKESLASETIDWYPFDTIGTFCLLGKFLSGERRDLLQILGQGPVLDLCCGDGDLSFFLETLGCKLHSVDWPVTNMNFMRGVRRMKEALRSRVEIHALDLDSRFLLPAQFYTAAFFFGALYHLKNPFYVLEKLADHAHYCFLSTRIAKYMPDRRTLVQGFPVAYLVGPEELNNDCSNYWVFSEAGLHRILTRANWEVCDWASFGAAKYSDPVHPEADERAYCLLRSRSLAGSQTVTLGPGWHELEHDAWRWTERRFSLTVSGVSEQHRKLLLRFSLLPSLAPLVITVSVNGVRLPAQVFREPGECFYAAFLPSPAATNHIECELDHALAPDGADLRERGVIVRTADLKTVLSA